MTDGGSFVAVSSTAAVFSTRGLASYRAGKAAVDALVVVSFGGPEGPEDVMPFLENVTRGRDVPRERLAEVAEQVRDQAGAASVDVVGYSAGGVVAVIIANIVAFFLMRAVGKNLDA